MKYHVLNTLNELAATASVLEKQAILKHNEDNALLKRVFRMAYDPSINYYITTGEPSVQHAMCQMEMSEALDILINEFTTRRLTGNAAKARLTHILNLMYPADMTVLLRILDRDLRCGTGTTLPNRVWPNLIPTFDFLLADTDPSNITYPALSQLKADGIRAAMFVDAERGIVSFMSRQGKPIETHDFFNTEGMRLTRGQTATLDGELICYEGDKPLDRKTSNGILNKAIKGTISINEAEKIRFLVWDINDPAGEHGYVERYVALERQLTEHPASRIFLIETKMVDTAAEALQHFKEVRRRGLEGTIVKNLNGKWVPKRSKDLCKFKAEVEGEFKVTGFEYGTGKNKSRVGALFVETADGLVKTKVGIFKDMDEKVRDELLVEMPGIVTILYNERITDKSRKDGTESLFLPRVTALRWDKSIANTRAELIEIEKAILKD